MGRARARIHPNGCGGLETKNKMYITSGGSGESHLYSVALGDFLSGSPFAPNTPAPNTVFAKHGGRNDAHGMSLNEASGGRYLWIADRFSNEMEVVDSQTDELVGSFGLSNSVSADPAPDLVEIAPGGRFGLVTFRGSCPITANSPTFNKAVGNRPGLGLIRVKQGGRSGEVECSPAKSKPGTRGIRLSDSDRRRPRKHH